MPELTEILKYEQSKKEELLRLKQSQEANLMERETALNQELAAVARLSVEQSAAWEQENNKMMADFKKKALSQVENLLGTMQKKAEGKIPEAITLVIKEVGI